MQGDKGMAVLPSGLECYKQTKTFTQDSVPAGFLKEHSTKAGAWGLLVVENGSLQYVVTEAGHEASFVLDANCPGVIVPEQKHHISVTSQAAFHIEFYREGAA